MSVGERIEELENVGHQFKIQDGQLRVTSILAKLNSAEVDWLKANRPAVINFLSGRILSMAIDRVAKHFDSRTKFSGESLKTKHKLDALILDSIENVNRWESGWFKLIADMKGAENAS